MVGTGRFLKLHLDLLRNPKWAALSHAERGLWVHVLLSAKAVDDPTFRDGSLAIVLSRDGWPRNRIPTTIERWVNVGLLEDQGDGYAVHDWDDWQATMYPSDHPDRVRDRVRRHREAKRAETTETGRGDERRGEEKEGTRFTSQTETERRKIEERNAEARRKARDELRAEGWKL